MRMWTGYKTSRKACRSFQPTFMGNFTALLCPRPLQALPKTAPDTAAKVFAGKEYERRGIE